MNDLTRASFRGDDASTAKIVYILYLVAIAIPVTILVGVVMAYVYRTDAPPVLRSHYDWQIRTFWIALLLNVLGWITVKVAIGWLILLYLLVWLIVRCVRGLRWLDRDQSVPRPRDWLFG